MENPSPKGKLGKVTAWHTRNWKSGWLGKLKVAGAWWLLAMAIAVPVAGLIPDVELELRTDIVDRPALLCRQQESFKQMIDATDPTNQALMDKFRNQPQVQARIIDDRDYMKREMWALTQETMRQIAKGNCLEVTHSDPMTARYHDWHSANRDPLVTENSYLKVTYKGNPYWVYASELQEATGVVVSPENRAPLMVSRKPPQEVKNASSAPAEKASTSTQSANRPVPKFARGQSYTSVRQTLLSDGWQPVITPDADICMEGDTRCEGRPEMQYCSGSGMAMCQFKWKRESQQLGVCTMGEENASFHSYCD